MNPDSHHKALKTHIGGQTSLTKKVSRRTVLFSIAVAALIFALDLASPLGVAGGVLYILLVMTGWWFRNKSAPIYLAVISTVLTTLGYFYSTGDDTAWLVLFNRLYALVAIWSVAILIYLTTTKQLDFYA